MTLVFKYVTGNEATGPLGLLTQVENNRYPNLMIGTDCENPATLNEYANWHFRVENVPASYITNNIYPRKIDGPQPPTSGTWIHTDHIPCREDCACNELENWPLYFVPTDNEDGTYTWDIFIVPYLGGAVIPGIEPKLPIPTTKYRLEIYDADNEQTYTTLTSAQIPSLFPVFGTARAGKTDADFYPALFGSAANYLDTRSSGPHDGVDIIPKGLYNNPPVSSDWDDPDTYPQHAAFREVYAITDGSLVLQTDTETGNVDMFLIPGSSSPYYGLSFGYVHVIPDFTQNTSVSAGAKIGVINSHQDDSRAGGLTHLHFDVRIHPQPGPGPVKYDPRQFIYPGLTPNP